MAEKEEGFIGSIRRLSRRLSGNILSPDVRDVKLYLIRNDKRNIYTVDSEDEMRIGGVVLSELAEEYGTPTYIYDTNRIVDNYNQYLGSFKNSKSFTLAYAVKANPNLALLNLFHKLGSSFDVVSGGEISRCLAAGIEPSKIVFSGCGKSLEEIDYAVKSDVSVINVESWLELDRIESVANKYGKIQNISIRINPDLNLDGHSHPNILTGSHGHKFGVPISEALEIYSRAKASASVRIKGIACHLGSNISQLEPFLEARDKLLHLADELRQESRICVEHINLGGGFAASVSTSQETPDIPQWVEKLAKPITERGLKLILEPGRSLVADAGVLLTKVEYVKTSNKVLSGTTSPRSGSFIGTNPLAKPPQVSTKTFAIVDAGFNDFARTALYGQQHQIVPVKVKHVPVDPATGVAPEFKYDVAGPICETTDVFAKDLVLHQPLESGDLIIIADAGAYGSSMRSSYNTRNKAVEVLITDNHPVVIRERESYEEQYAHEKIVHDLKIKALNNLLEEAEGSTEDLVNNNA